MHSASAVMSAVLFLFFLLVLCWFFVLSLR